MITSDFAQFHFEAEDPTQGDITLKMEYPPFNVSGGSNEITDADLIDIGNRLLESDYIRGQSWGATAVLRTVRVPSNRQVHPPL